MRRSSAPFINFSVFGVLQGIELDAAPQFSEYISVHLAWHQGDDTRTPQG